MRPTARIGPVGLPVGEPCSGSSVTSKIRICQFDDPTDILLRGLQHGDITRARPLWGAGKLNAETNGNNKRCRDQSLPQAEGLPPAGGR